MKYVLLAITLLAIIAVYAYEAGSINGDIYSLMRFSYNDSLGYSRLETGVNLSINGEIFRKSLYSIDLKVRTMDKMPAMFEELSTEMIYPELIVREMYFKQRAFPVKGIDIKAGRQILRWGSGMLLSVTDNVNPDNYDDPWLYGEKYGNEMIVIDAYKGGLSSEIFAAPLFRPSLINPTGSAFEMEGVRTAMDGNELLMPEGVYENINAGIRTAYSKAGYMGAISYIYTRDTYPWPERIVLAPSTSPSYVNSMTYLHYPRMHTGTLEFSGVAGDFSYWAEYALFYIDSIEYEIDLSALGRGIDTLQTIESNFYSKGLAGFDYRPNDIFYFNVQYMKGFYSERGDEGCAHYLFTGMLITPPNSGFTIEPLNWGIEMRSFTDEDDVAYVYSPAMTYTKQMFSIRLAGMTGVCGENTMFNQGFQHEIELGFKYVF